MVPKKIITILDILENSGYEAYLVGGCVRSILLNREPKDWDITTNAKPEEILKLFPAPKFNSIYENKFGTVTVIPKGWKLPGVEITPFRIEGKYSDKRRPDEIKFAKTLDEDLGRRDFTVNAIALQRKKEKLKRKNNNLKLKSYNTPTIIINKEEWNIIDLFGGIRDIKGKIIRAVGKANDRFNEDALRMMRAIRFAVELGFIIEDNTFQAIKNNALNLNFIAKERIRDEFIKIILSVSPKEGIMTLYDTNLLKLIIPELTAGIGEIQRGPHRHDIFTHNARALKFASEYTSKMYLRLAALFHDIGKTYTKNIEADGSITFYNHPIVGAEITDRILNRLRFSQKTIQKITHLVKHHMFYYDIGKVTDSGVRRFLNRIGKENFEDFLILRKADRQATPVPKAEPYRLRHLKYMVDKVSEDPLSRFQLVINGDDILSKLKIKATPRIGLLINALLIEVLDNPEKNKKEYLLSRIVELNKLSEKELKQKTMAIRERKQERDKTLKEKHLVK
ncbi:MAG: CCA tRNA nucleotidyltransferase [Patescibacteria group bacterium]